MKNNDSPVFLIASERSGTNLLRKRITENQNFYYGPPAAHFYKHMYSSTPYYGDLYEDDNFLRLIDFALELCYNHFAPWEINLTNRYVLKEYSKTFKQRDAILLGHFLMTEYAKFKGYQSYFCKDNNLFEFIFIILYRIPNARFIYLYRDPRDFAVSQLNRTLYTNNIFRIAEMWRQEQIKALAAIQLLDSKGVYKTSYEEFITKENESIEALLDFLKVKKFKVAEKTSERTVVNVEEWSNLSLPTLNNNYKKYLKELSSFQIKVIESVCWHQMWALGYQTEYSKKPKINPLFIKLYYFTYLVYDKVLQFFIRKMPQFQWIVKRNKAIKRYKFY